MAYELLKRKSTTDPAAPIAYAFEVYSQSVSFGSYCKWRGRAAVVIVAKIKIWKCRVLGRKLTPTDFYRKFISHLGKK